MWPWAVAILVQNNCRISGKPYIGLETVLVHAFMSACHVIAIAEIIHFARNLAQMFMFYAK